jgi:hypothetical protein
MKTAIQINPEDRAIYTYYDRRRNRDEHKPSLTAAGGRRILSVWKNTMRPGEVSRINPGLTNALAYQILWDGIKDVPDQTPITSLVAGNILKTCGISKKHLAATQ